MGRSGTCSAVRPVLRLYVSYQSVQSQLIALSAPRNPTARFQAAPAKILSIVPVQTPKQHYSREEACRYLAITERQLRSWEKQKLVSAASSFGFKDLMALKALVELRKHHLRPERIRKVVGAVRDKFRGMEDPLTCWKVFTDGRRIGVQIAGKKMEPISGQLLLDFDGAELNKLLSFPARNDEEQDHRAKQARKVLAEKWFQKGIELEQTGAPVEQIIQAYRQASELDEKSVGALVNLGTLYFNIRKFSEAEQSYRKAIEIDPKYALAHFNLGNLYDERGDRQRALAQYQAAIQLYPNYADAHYNLALLYQTMGQVMKAVQHWRQYLKLDPGSSWAVIARRELDKLRRATLVPGRK
jgi:tetratricopeptide (TPR) repeat protein